MERAYTMAPNASGAKKALIFEEEPDILKGYVILFLIYF